MVNDRVSEPSAGTELITEMNKVGSTSKSLSGWTSAYPRGSR
jgi:hypothetical protein